jgi:CAAX prenyl protease-like protein
VRILPFAVFMVFLAIGSALPPPEPVPPGDLDSRWNYAARTLAVGILLAVLWSRYGELRAAPRMGMTDWLVALVSGGAVFVVWILLDYGWMTLGDLTERSFDPRRYASDSLHIPLTVLRLLGLAVVVPIAEELFWRSFLLRWLQQQHFLALDPRVIGARAIAVSSVLFALEHNQWLAGLIAGVAYAGVYVRTGKLWTAIVSHAVTNTMLGAWILFTRDWRFW